MGIKDKFSEAQQITSEPIDEVSLLGDPTLTELAPDKFLERWGQSTVDQLPENYKLAREEILSTIESNEKGLDIEGVYNFLDSYGFTRDEMANAVIIDSDDLVTSFNIAQIYRKYNIPVPTNLGIESINDFKKTSFFDPELNIAFINRDKKLEELNNVEYTEGYIVHELVHSVRSHEKCYVKIEDQYVKPRVGLSVRGRVGLGNFFEEGFADYLRGEYIKHKNACKYTTDRESEFFGDSTDSVILLVNGHQIPLKYIHIDGNSSEDFGANVSSPAAFGLEILIAKDTRLLRTIINAKKGNIEALRKIPILINNISPGLYPYLSKIQYGMDNFWIGLERIIQKIFNVNIGEIPLNNAFEVKM